MYSVCSGTRYFKYKFVHKLNILRKPNLRANKSKKITTDALRDPTKRRDFRPD